MAEVRLDIGAPLGTQGMDIAKRNTKDFLVKKKERGQSLILGRS